MTDDVALLDERMAHPTHQGSMADATGVGAVGNPACGDVITLYVKVVEGVIAQASFESTGSAYQLATASVLCDCITGQTVDEARRRRMDCITDRLPDLPTNKQYLARLAVDAVSRALDDHERRAAGLEPEEPTRATPEEAEVYVVGMLANGRPWGTAELDAMARADGMAWPVPLAKFLADLRGRNVIAGDLVGTSWRWWSHDAAPGLGQPGDEEPKDDGEST